MRLRSSTAGAVLLAALAGCANPSSRPAGDTMRLSWDQSETSRAFDAWHRSAAKPAPGTEFTPPPFPGDGVAVQARTLKVSHPALSSPSLVGDTSEAVLELTEGSIPGHPEIRRIVMGFDRHNPRAALEAGQRCVLLFTKDGRFFGYDLLAGPAPAPAP